jgi:hypothetical protein
LEERSILSSDSAGRTKLPDDDIGQGRRGSKGRRLPTTSSKAKAKEKGEGMGEERKRREDAPKSLKKSFFRQRTTELNGETKTN